MWYFCEFLVKNMPKVQPDTSIHEKCVKFQVEFPGNQIQFPGSQNPLDRIFYTYAISSLFHGQVFDLIFIQVCVG